MEDKAPAHSHHYNEEVAQRLARKETRALSQKFPRSQPHRKSEVANETSAKMGASDVHRQSQEYRQQNLEKYHPRICGKTVQTEAKG